MPANNNNKMPPSPFPFVLTLFLLILALYTAGGIYLYLHTTFRPVTTTAAISTGMAADLDLERAPHVRFGDVEDLVDFSAGWERE